MSNVNWTDGQPSTAEALVLALVDQGVDAIFFNPGSDTAPYQEAFAVLAARGVPVPRIVLCPHEAVALAAAHGRAVLSGRTQVVMVHVDVGTQNLGSMVHNAMRGRAGVVIMAGLTPMTSLGELPGGRDTEVHWIQDVPDQAGVVRSYVKWASTVGDASTAVRKLHRAFQIAGTNPCGPVYLTVTREILMGSVSQRDARLSPVRYGAAVPPEPNKEELERAAKVLRAARRPVVVTARLGQKRDAVQLLVDVVDRLGAVVIDRRERVNFPSSHGAYCLSRAAGHEALSSADAVLVVDCPVPWVPSSACPPASATVISLDSDPLRASMPDWSFPIDINLHCDPHAGLARLLELLPERDGSMSRPEKAAQKAVALSAPSKETLSAEKVTEALNQVLREDDVVIEELTTYGPTLRGGIVRDRPGTYFRSGGSGLGWALGASLGMKLNLPDRRVVVLVGDGAFLYGAPVPALWALNVHASPVVILVLRNGGYAASRLPVFSLYPHGRSSETRDVVGTLFTDPPDLIRIAEACGGGGRLVKTVRDLVPALEGALAESERGRPMVVTIDVPSTFIEAQASSAP